MRHGVSSLVVCLAGLALILSQSRAQEPVEAADPATQAEAAEQPSPPSPESASQLAPGARRPAQGPEFRVRADAVRQEVIATAAGALAHAERAEAQRASLVADGRDDAAARAQRIAETALRLAEMIVRRERARARVLLLQGERTQIAHRLEQARSVLDHQRELPADFPPDPNIETEDPDPGP